MKMMMRMWGAVALLMMSGLAQAAPAGKSGFLGGMFGGTEPAKTSVEHLKARVVVKGPSAEAHLSLKVQAGRDKARVVLMGGALSLLEFKETKHIQIHFDEEKGEYSASFEKPGAYELQARFLLKVSKKEGDLWQGCAARIAEAGLRELEVETSGADGEVRMANALRGKRERRESTTLHSCVLKPGAGLELSWSEGNKADLGRLVLSAESSAIFKVEHGSIKGEMQFKYEVAQGGFSELSLAIPAGMVIRGVNGEYIREWKVDDKSARLLVQLNHNITDHYSLAVQTEQAFKGLPAEVQVGALAPQNCIRSAGTILVGSDHAIQSSLRDKTGLIQVNTGSFEMRGDKNARRLPQLQSYCFKHPGADYSLKLALRQIMPVVDVVHQLSLELHESNTVLSDEMEVNVMDAPLKVLKILLPAGFAPTEVKAGELGEDDMSVQDDPATGRKTLVLNLHEGMLGRGVLRLVLERPGSPLEQDLQLSGLETPGHRVERGTLKLSAEKGLHFDVQESEALREVNVASVAGAEAQKAFRFKNEPWRLKLTTRKKVTGLHVESLHIMTLSRNMIQGSVALSCFINGAPIQDIRVKCPPGFEHVEFVGRDVVRWTRENDEWLVRLSRKVIGDYNLALVYHAKPADESKLVIDNITCPGAETQSGTIVVTSHMGMTLESLQALPAQMMTVSRDEIPGHYQLLIGSPVVSSYRHIGAPAAFEVRVDSFPGGETLPALIEMADIRTEMVPGRDGQTEVKTTLSYKIINTDMQYMTLTMPEGVKIWSTRLKAGEGVEFKKVASTLEGRTLKIPLQRNKNPNDPSTLEIEYGESRRVTGWPASLNISAPAHGMSATFSHWQVGVPPEWTVRLRSGGLGQQLSPRSAAQFLGHVFTQGRDAVGSALRRYPQFWAAWVLFWVATGTVLRLRRSSAFATFARAGILLTLAAVGLVVASGIKFPPMAAGSSVERLDMQDALQLTGDSMVEHVVEILPNWQASLLEPEFAILLGMSLLLGLVALKKGGLRRPLAALSLASLLAALLCIRSAWPLMLHGLTWVWPLLACVWMLILAARRRPAPVMEASQAGASSVLVLLALALIPVLAGRTDAASPAPSMMLKDFQCDIRVEKDALLVAWDLDFEAHKGMEWLLPEQAILLDHSASAKVLQVEQRKGRLACTVLHKGRLKWKVRFLLPRSTSDDLQGFVAMDGLPALKNKVTLHILSRNNLEVTAPRAVSLAKTESKVETTVEAVFSGSRIELFWKPGLRDRSGEKPRYFSRIISHVLFERGLVQARHRVHLSLPQGVLRQVLVRVPAGDAVTAVSGATLSSWRFTPEAQQLEINLAREAQGTLDFDIVTESPVARLPYERTFESLSVAGAEQEVATLGFSSGKTVNLACGASAGSIAPESFLKTCVEFRAALLAGESKPAIEYAFQIEGAKPGLKVAVSEKLTELRSREESSFSISDERLVYNARLDVNVSKAGVFSLDVALPEGYDIDQLHNPLMTHWEELGEGGARVCRIYLSELLLGETSLAFTLSRNSNLTEALLQVPALRLAGVLKHHGQLVVSAEQGIRLNTATRNGASELKSTLSGDGQQVVKTFRLLQSDWAISLQPEIIRPRINVEGLMVHDVGDGVVRHRAILHFKMYNAGVKSLEVKLPQGAQAVVIQGPRISLARETATGSGEWVVRLDEKWYGSQYPLQINYETRFDIKGGALDILPLEVRQVDLWKGYVAIRNNGYQELLALSLNPALVEASARQIPAEFSAGDLSSSVFCFTSAEQQTPIRLGVQRHVVTPLMEAKVTSTRLTTVVSAAGAQVHELRLNLRVGNKRFLHLRLPDDAALWSVRVAGRSVVPAIKPDGRGRLLMIQLPHAAGEMDSLLELVYALRRPASPELQQVKLKAPSVDIPLGDIQWTCFVPEGWRADPEAGSLTPDFDRSARQQVRKFDLGWYDSMLSKSRSDALDNAVQYQRLSEKLANSGQQIEARQAMENAFNFSSADAMLNEDARVQLHRLAEKQALVGLHGNRSALRARSGEGFSSQSKMLGQDWGANFKAEDADRLCNALPAEDSENLELIARRIVEVQASSMLTPAQLDIHLPTQGQELKFSRPMLVDPYGSLELSFDVAQPDQGALRHWLILLPMALALWLALAGFRRTPAVGE